MIMKAVMKLLIILNIIFIYGCQQSTEKPTNDRESDEPMTQVSDKSTASSNTDIAEHLTNIATKVPNVHEATALIAGPYAVVGIDVDKDLDRSSVGVVKYSVSEALHDDPYGKTAIVIADGDIRQRLNNMREDMADGKPVRGIIDELAAIVGRYMPQMPINEDERIIDDEDQQEIISDEDEEQLDNIQKEQSTE